MYANSDSDCLARAMRHKTQFDAVAKQHFAGDYDKFPETDRELENQLSGHNVKNKNLVQDGDINCQALYVIMLMSIALIKHVTGNKVGL